RQDSHYSLGLGVRADVDGRTVVVGSRRLLGREGVTLPDAAEAMVEAAGRRGESAVLVACDGRPIGLIAYADAPRPEARSAHGLPETVDVARESMALIHQSLAIVGVPNALGLGLATFGRINPVAAAALNNGSNVAAALNALRPLMRKSEL